VGDDDDFAAGHAADAGDQARGRRLAVVHVRRRQRGQLEGGRAGVEEAVDALANGQLPLTAMPLQIFFAASLSREVGALAQLGYELIHSVAVLLKLRRIGSYPRLEE